MTTTITMTPNTHSHAYEPLLVECMVGVDENDNRVIEEGNLGDDGDNWDNKMTVTTK
jgi:hypothetical protein